MDRRAHIFGPWSAQPAGPFVTAARRSRFRLGRTRPRPARPQRTATRVRSWHQKENSQLNCFFMLRCVQLHFHIYTLWFMCCIHTYLPEGVRTSSTKSVHSILHRTSLRHVCCRLREDSGITASTCSLACHVNTASLRATKNHVRGML